MRRQHGMALVVTLVLLAGLTWLVAAQLAVGRADLRAAHTQRTLTHFSALADGAIRTLAVRLSGTALPGFEPMRDRVDIGTTSLEVEALPATGFIDLNLAPVALLEDALVFGAGVDIERAHRLAQAIVRWRDPDLAEDIAIAADRAAVAGRRGGFITVEDLLLVPGMDTLTFSQLLPVVTVHSPLDGVDPRSAPAAVLTVLTRGDAAHSQRLLDARAHSSSPPDLASLPHALTVHTTPTVFLMIARGVHAERMLERRRWIALERRPADAVAWRELDAQPVRVVPETAAARSRVAS